MKTKKCCCCADWHTPPNTRSVQAKDGTALLLDLSLLPAAISTCLHRTPASQESLASTPVAHTAAYNYRFCRLKAHFQWLAAGQADCVQAVKASPQMPAAMLSKAAHCAHHTPLCKITPPLPSTLPPKHLPCHSIKHMRTAAHACQYTATACSDARSLLLVLLPLPPLAANELCACSCRGKHIHACPCCSSVGCCCC